MAIQHFLINVHSGITVISFITFIGIIWWSYFRKRQTDFDEAALLPFADDEQQFNTAREELIARERQHG
ncbi:MAG: CcoQ/FixQ family Cbb3-type cytochrome c oxidase assembly chaperone [Collimonas sp.]|uniref:cbb3-type cytochrome oxidase subunit 3 n=1 Tax=Collimonas sp. TaxID=1963772 RepID=UPI0032631FA1